jgi:predicted PolB exonuclease-like 3'-5' exonuclease
MAPSSPIVVFDVETVPDREALRRVSKPPASAESLDGAIKPACQQIVAIAAAWIAPNGALQRLGALGDQDWTEAQLVQAWFDLVAHHRPRLVGWNSGGFDLPVLVYRAMVHRVVAADFYQVGEPYHSYRRRFDEDSHVDLMDVLSFYGASTRLKLDEMAAVLGVPGKLGIDGKNVDELYQAGEVSTIRSYCETDVLTTALIYGRYAEHRGWWAADQVLTFERSVAEWLIEQTTPVWVEFRNRWQAFSSIAAQGPVEDAPGA